MKVFGVASASGLLYTFLAVSSLSSSVLGQITGAPNLSTVSNVNGISDTNSATGSASATGSSTGSGTGTATGSASTGTGSSSVSSGSASSGASGTQTVPRLTTTSAAGGLTGLPKLSNGYTIPTAAVPPTSNAPYMKTSSMPEGTVFIAVGAILGFMALTVLAWRGITAWSLHRAMNRAASADSTMDKKALFRTPAPVMYNYTDRESKASLSNLGGKTKKNIFGDAPGAANPGSLFFSPTAGAAGSGAGGGNRGSSYLPAGYYAAGASQPGDGRGSTYIGSQPVRESISLTTLAPHSQGYARPAEFPSPPDSPAFMPGHHTHQSTSTLDLRLPNGRAPSAVLDDLFEGSAENLPRQGRY